MTHKPALAAPPAISATPTATAAPTADTARPPTRLTETGGKRFLDELADIGSVSEAARRSRTPRASLYRRRDDDPEFAAAWNTSMLRAIDRLQDEAMLRAIEGVERPVFYRGEQVGAVRQASDRLLMFLLRAHRREKYDPNYVKPWQPPGEAEATGGSIIADLMRGL